MAEPDHFEFRVQPHDVRIGEWCRIEVAILDASGNVVPLDGTQVYVGLWREGDDHPSNQWPAGDRFVYTINGIAVFDLYVSDKGTYRFKPDQIICPHSSGPMVLNCSVGHSR
jgi:hypothetical protein